MRGFSLMAVILIGVAACAVPAGGPGVVTGRLVAGPICPVETDPPDPFCAPAPVAGAQVTFIGAIGEETTVFSGPEGEFRAEVPPGAVTVRFGDVPGLMGTPPEMTVQVAYGQTVDVGDISYDTGIR